MESQGSQRFRGTRQFVGNLVCVGAGILLFVILSISVVVDPPLGGGESSTLAVALIFLAALVGLLIRMRWAFTVEIEAEDLIYRTLLRTVRFARSDIQEIGIEERHRGMAKIKQPYLRLRDGRIAWLADMGQGVLISPSSHMQEELVNFVSQWIE